MIKKIRWKVLVVSLIIVYAVALIGGLFTSRSVNSDWYQTTKTSITPPNFVFPIVWNILFFLIGLSLYFSWINSKRDYKFKIALVFGINFVLNISWSIIYFGLKNLSLAFFELILLWVSIWLIIFVTCKLSKISTWLLIPYLIWVVFAGILNFLSAF